MNMKIKAKWITMSCSPISPWNKHSRQIRRLKRIWMQKQIFSFHERSLFKLPKGNWNSSNSEEEEEQAQTKLLFSLCYLRTFATQKKVCFLNAFAPSSMWFNKFQFVLWCRSACWLQNCWSKRYTNSLERQMWNASWAFFCHIFFFVDVNKMLHSAA